MKLLKLFVVVGFVFAAKSAFAVDMKIGHSVSVVQQELTVKVGPLSCPLQEDANDTLTCYMNHTALKLPRGGQLVPVWTTNVADKVTIKAYPRDSQFIQIQLSRPTESQLDLKAVWQSSVTSAVLIYQGPAMR